MIYFSGKYIKYLKNDRIIQNTEKSGIPDIEVLKYFSIT